MTIEGHSLEPRHRPGTVFQSPSAYPSALPAPVLVPLAVAEDTRPTAPPSAVTRWLLRAEFFVLLVVVATRVHGYTTHVDIHVWDELVYLLGGVELVEHGTMPSVAYSPGLSLAYAVLHMLPVSGHLPDVMYGLCAAGAPLALWWALRPMVASPLPLLAAAALACIAPIHQADHIGFHALPLAYAFTLGLLCVAVGMLARGWLALCVAMFALAALSRGENAPWLAGFAVVSLWAAPLRGRVFAKIGLVAVAFVVLAFTVLHEANRARSWFAFRQHYARAVVSADYERRGDAAFPVEPGRTVRDPSREIHRAFQEPDAYVQRDFPAAESLAEAVAVAPMRVVGFAADNLSRLPQAVLAASRPHFLPEPVYAWVAAAVVGLALSGFVFARRRTLAPAVAASQTPLVRILLWTSPIALLVPLTVDARPELTLPLVPLVAASVGAGLARFLRGVGPRARSVVSLATVAVVLVAAVLVPSPFDGPEPPLQYRDQLLVMRESLPRVTGLPIHVLSTWNEFQMPLVGREDVVGVRLPLSGPLDLAALLEREHIDCVLVTPQLEYELARDPKALATLQSRSWREVRRLGACVLYERMGL